MTRGRHDNHRSDVDGFPDDGPAHAAVKLSNLKRAVGIFGVLELLSILFYYPWSPAVLIGHVLLGLGTGVGLVIFLTRWPRGTTSATLTGMVWLALLGYYYGHFTLDMDGPIRGNPVMQLHILVCAVKGAVGGFLVGHSFDR